MHSIQCQSIQTIKHRVKSVQILSYFWSVFSCSCIRTEYRDLPYLDTSRSENFSNLNNNSTAMHLGECQLDKVRLWGFSQNFPATILYFEKSWLWICSFLWMNLIFKDLPFLHAKRMKIVQFTYYNLLVYSPPSKTSPGLNTRNWIPSFCFKLWK